MPKSMFVTCLQMANLNFRQETDLVNSGLVDYLIYCKVPKLWDARNLCCNLPKFKQRGQTFRVFCQNGSNGIANSADPYQTAPRGAV